MSGHEAIVQALIARRIHTLFGLPESRVMRIHTADKLRAAIRAALPNQVPTLIEVPVGEMPSPWPVSFLPTVRH